MTGLVRKASLIGVCGLLAATTAFAGAPSPGNSTLPSVLRAYGTFNGVPHSLADGAGNPRSATITVRDFTNNPINGANVVIDFTNCTDYRPCNMAIAGAGVVTCGPNRVSGTTNAAGQLTLTLVGSGKDVSGALFVGPLASGACAEILANSTSLGFAKLFVANPTGTGGTAADNEINGADNSRFFLGFGVCATPGGACYQRFDYNGNGNIQGDDLAAQFLIFGQSAGGAGGGKQGCSTGGAIAGVYCP